MRVEAFQPAPSQALEIRQKVFVEEQGFQNEFDTVDLTAVHFVLFDDCDIPIATCRVFEGAEKGTYILGRLAVTKENRGKSMGSQIVKKAEEYVKKIGGEEIRLHSQCHAAGFYEKSGFTAFGEIEYEEDCPHVWMKKKL